jgi:hypothetical protein
VGTLLGPEETGASAFVTQVASTPSTACVVGGVVACGAVPAVIPRLLVSFVGLLGGLVVVGVVVVRVLRTA